MDEKAFRLTPGIDTFTLPTLLKRAAAVKRLKLRGEGKDGNISEPIASVFLYPDILAFLKNRKIRRQARPDCNGKIVTLVDENEQAKVPGWSPSNYWNFQALPESQHEFDLRITLSVKLQLSLPDHGFRLIPQAHGTFVSAADLLPNFRMFKALIEWGAAQTPPIAHELADSDGHVVVTWEGMDLTDLRTTDDLFDEFAGGNEAVKRIARNDQVFSPTPYSHGGDQFFIARPAQQKMLLGWRFQLRNYRDSLKV